MLFLGGLYDDVLFVVFFFGIYVAKIGEGERVTHILLVGTPLDVSHGRGAVHKGNEGGGAAAVHPLDLDCLVVVVGCCFCFEGNVSAASFHCFVCD